MSLESELRDAMCEVGRRLYERNLVVATDGNLTVRLDESRFLSTASGKALGELCPDDIVVANARGERVAGEGKVNSEIFMHLTAYELRPDVHAVIHAHPPKAVGLTVAGVSLEEYVLPELVIAVGGVPTADYATPGTNEGAGVIRSLICDCDALMLDRHGALTVGDCILDAYRRMEKIEHAAESILAARLLGDVEPLDSDQLVRIFRARDEYGARGKVYRPGI